MNPPTARLQAQHGFATMLAIVVLAILAILAGTAMTAALAANGGSNNDHGRTRALGAAEAGLQVARYRLNMAVPADATATSGTGTAGEGETFTYAVSSVATTAGTTCAGKTMQVASTAVAQRCVTAIGRAPDGVRRLQELLTTYPGETLFPSSGILGLDGVSITENGVGDVAGPIGSNGAITLSGCKTGVSATIWDPGPLGTFSETCTGTATQAAPARTAAWTLSALDSVFTPPNTADPAGNDNDEVFPRAGFSYTYNAATGARELKDTANATLTLNGTNPRTGDNTWVFNFCKLTLTHVTKIVLTGGAKARFLIDDSTRPGSSCAAGSSLTMTGVSGMNFDNTVTPGVPGDPTALQFLVYGAATVAISNQSGFSASIFAPQTEVKFTNKTVYYGAINAKRVTATNGLDFHGQDVSGVRKPGRNHFNRLRWIECRSTPSNPANIHSGC